MTAAHDFECYRQGWSDLPRHPFICLGPGAWHSWPHADGIGTFNLSNVILIQKSDGRFYLLDYNTDLGDHRSKEAMLAIMGFGTDKEVVSFCLTGVCWKVDAPRQLRIGHNLFSLKSRARGVGEATAKLVAKGLYRAEPVLVEGEPPLHEGSRSPAFCLPQYSVGMGGADKNDKPDEKRPTSNTSDPHRPVRERNAPHGEADGPPVVSFNDKTGPRRVPKDYSGPPLPFPDKENKCTQRMVYAANALMCALAVVNGSTPAASRDDVRWCFFQKYLHPSQYWLSIQYLVIGRCRACGKFAVLCVCIVRLPNGEELVLFRILPRVMNMGVRPASKIAVRWTQQWNVEWRDRMADHVHAVWLPQQSPALKDVLADRERRLGYAHAHPFATLEFTDDFWDVSCDIALTAHGSLTRRKMSADMNVWMSSKAAAGTCVDYIGGVHVLAGGFGTISPAKRARCAEQTIAALTSGIDREAYVANNSFAVHVVDLLDADPSILQGLWAPAMRVVANEAIICLADDANRLARRGYERLLCVVTTRPAAAFAAGIVDAPCATATNAPSAGPAIFLRMSSDCRADGDRMTIFGALLEFEWGPIRLADIDHRWAERHVNVGEMSGAAVNVAVFGLTFGGHFELIHEGDNMSEGPMLLGRAKTPDAVYISQRMRQTRGFKACHDKLWWEHSAGLGLGFTDAGSREYTHTLANLAAAFGRRRVRVDVERQMPEVMQMLADILENTTEYVKKRRGRVPLPPPPFSPSASDQRALLPAHEGLGPECPADPAGNSASHVALSPTPPRPVGPPGPVAPEEAPAPPLPPTPHRISPVRAPDGLSDRVLTPTPPRALATNEDGETEGRGATHLSPSPTRPSTRQLCGSVAAPDLASLPATADAARARAAVQASDRLLAEALALGATPAQLEATRGTALRAHACVGRGIPRGTRGHDSSGFQWMRRFGLAHGLSWMRPLASSAVDIVTEVNFVAMAVFWIAGVMPSCARRAADGYTRAMPPSALSAIYGWRRVLADCGCYLASMLLAAKVLKGLVADYKRDFGQDAMTAQHHVPFELDVVRRCVAALQRRAMRTHGWSDTLHHAIEVMITFCMVRGPRLDELCEMMAGDTFYRRANFAWCSGARVVGSSAVASATTKIAADAVVRAQNVPSKTDRSGRKWGGKYMYYRKNALNPLNFASAWESWDLRNPCPESERARWPAFSPSGDHVPFAPALARRCLRELLTEVESLEYAESHWWHNFRATVCSALIGAEKTPEVAQAMLCWASSASVALYGQMSATNMADTAELASQTDAARHAHLPRPHIDAGTVADELEACVALMRAPDAGAAAAEPAVIASGARKRAAAAPRKRVQTPAAAPRTAPPPAPVPPAPTPSTALASPAAPAKVARRRPPTPRRGESPSPACEAASAVIDVGAPLGPTSFSLEHAFIGQSASVPAALVNGAGPATDGVVACEIIGAAPALEIDGVPGVFALRAAADAPAFALHTVDIKPCLSTVLRRLL